MPPPRTEKFFFSFLRSDPLSCEGGQMAEEDVAGVLIVPASQHQLQPQQSPSPQPLLLPTTVTTVSSTSVSTQDRQHGAQARLGSENPVSVLRRRLVFGRGGGSSGNSTRRQKAKKFLWVCLFFLVFVSFMLLTLWATSARYTDQLRLSFGEASRRGYSKVWWEKVLSLSNTTPKGTSGTCANTKQGGDWIADSRGVLCLRKDVLSTGCCDTTAVASSRFSCTGCADTGAGAGGTNFDCCELYEGCVSCCMAPEHLEGLNVLVKSVFNGDSAAAVVTEENSFSLCNALCRTSSKSVVRQRFYKSPKHKYCYN